MTVVRSNFSARVIGSQLRKCLLASLAFIASSLGAAPVFHELADVREVPSLARSSGSCSHTAVVFIHGIFGSSETWRTSRENASFPELLASDPDMEGHDIFEVTYRTTFFDSDPKRQDASEIVETIVDRLDPKLTCYERIHFVAHSLGGNLARHYLVRLKTKTPTPPGPHSVMRRYKSLVLLGTPSYGADIASFARLISNAPTLRVLEPVDSNDWLKAMNYIWKSMADRQKMSSMLVEGELVPLRIFAGYESLPYLGLNVVTKVSATALHPYEVRCFKKNHSTIAKPLNRSDTVYRWVKSALLDRNEVLPSECPNDR